MMELKATNDPEFFDIVDETGTIGHLSYAHLDPDEDPEYDSEGWCASFTGLDAGQTEFLPTAAEAMAAAWVLYEKLVAERKRIAKYYRDRNTRFISTPMGGQPK